ncbi:hypothetical protein NG99_25565 [Erwinia typographi]|uniref:DUF2509 domain-containing protein n=1 Tax=Erwinia typographi TaxID=371042 RepID=A0A0A3YI30_9GAMM|nr:DUF2509 family protein [Erwinia typographi]KGT86422.1 hypothetical protein NG99_25565 [Erwinia typographi]
MTRRHGQQQGGGALTVVILLLALSAALLNATRRQLDAGLSRVADERQFMLQTTLAMSALSWGARQSWPSGAGWQCLQDADGGWRSCLGAAEEERELLRGDSGADSVALYQWVSERGPQGQVSALPHGWLDYCPLSEEARCDPDEATAGL